MRRDDALLADMALLEKVRGNFLTYYRAISGLAPRLPAFKTDRELERNRETERERQRT
jgi:hypothetical protein